MSYIDSFPASYKNGPRPGSANFPAHFEMSNRKKFEMVSEFLQKIEFQNILSSTRIMNPDQIW